MNTAIIFWFYTAYLLKTHSTACMVFLYLAYRDNVSHPYLAEIIVRAKGQMSLQAE